MKTQIFVVALLLGAAIAGKSANQPCRVKHDRVQKKNVLKSQLQEVSLPDTWVWNDVNGRNYLTNLKNQHLPQYCGSCWAQAATSSLSDRIKIMRNATWPDINISP